MKNYQGKQVTYPYYKIITQIYELCVIETSDLECMICAWVHEECIDNDLRH